MDIFDYTDDLEFLRDFYHLFVYIYLQYVKRDSQTCMHFLLIYLIFLQKKITHVGISS